MLEFDSLDNVLNSYSNIILSAHVNPDGDAVSACIAFANALNRIGKNVAVVLEDYGDRYSFLDRGNFVFDDISKVQNLSSELFISLDCGDKSRLGKFSTLFDRAKTTVNIDHHISNDRFAQYNYVFESSSTSEIIYEALLYLNIELNDSIAKAIYTGIVYDTGGFKYSNTTYRTHEIAAELVKYNFSPTAIFKDMFDMRSYEATKILGRAIDKIEILFDRKIAVSCLTQNDIKQFNVEINQLGGIIDHLRNIKGVKASVFIYEKSENESKVSMRSDGYIDICKISSEFGGGGHLKACGCTIQCCAEEAKDIILSRIAAQMEQKE